MQYVAKELAIDDATEEHVREVFSERAQTISIYDLLDPGIASSVAALVDVGAVPFSSCNGGSLGGHHLEPRPIVAFVADEPVLRMIILAAEDAGVEFSRTTNGFTVEASSIEDMPRFAERLIA